MTRVAVLGAGSWGTAFSMVLADAGQDVALWGRRPEVCEAINNEHQNPDYLPDIELPRAVWATPRAGRGTRRCRGRRPRRPVTDPARRTSTSGPGCSRRDTVLVSLMKGIELGTTKRMSEVIAEVTGAGPERVAVVSGPNLAKEIALRQPAASVVACADEAVAEKLQLTCMTPYFRPYTNTDVIGVELGGAVKNVIALAVGIADGMGFGDNSKASIITRGLAEITRLGMALGADAATFAGLAGLGDLVATCMSPLSRNRTFGESLGRGMIARGGDRGDPPDRRGREVVRVHPRAGPRPRRRDADHRARRRSGARRPAAPRDRAPDHEPQHQVRERDLTRQGSRQVGPQVLDVLDPHREPDQGLRDLGALAGPAPAPLEAGLDPAEAGRVDPDRRRRAHAVGRRRRPRATSRLTIAPEPG